MSIVQGTVVRLGVVLDKVVSTLSGVFCRYFHGFDGIDDHVVIPVYTTNTAVEIEFMMSSSQTGVNRYIYDGPASGVNREYLFITAGDLFATASSAVTKVDGNASGTFPSDGLEHRVNIIYTSANNLDIATLMSRYTTNEAYEGIIWNFKIWEGTKETGTLVRSYNLDDNSMVVAESVSGQDGNIINSTSGQWVEICDVDGDGSFSDEFSGEF